MASTSKIESKDKIQSAVTEASRIVSEMAGIQLGPKQGFMVESRLKSRMLKLGLESYDEYLNFLKRNAETESQALLSLLTTHHTYFFREFSHFEFLLNSALEPMITVARARADKTIRIWSAACSRGQEVYSLAMFMNFHLSQTAPDLRFEIWGTDIDAESVAHAKNGVYRAEELKQSPAMYIDGNWTRGKGDVKNFSKVKDSLKAHCTFGTLNLLSCESALKGKTFDLIFCRNVFIYFDQNQIKQISKTFLEHVDPSGFLVLGVSESLNGLGLPVDAVGPSIYRRKLQKTEAVKAVAIPKVEEKKVLDVLCVDDSPAILALLSKILVPEHGYRVVAKAENGQRALEILKTQKFDIITLDLHMPELDGVGFLKVHGGRETPVVVISSINRDDLTIAQQAVSLGAKDYIEKPSLQSIGQAGNEIRSKLRTAYRTAVKSPAARPTTTIAAKVLSEKIRVLIVDDSKTIRTLLNEIVSQDPAMEVVGLAEKPSEVEALIQLHKPHVITLDIHMPEMDGVTLLKKIFPKYKIPCVMISSISPEEGPAVLQALEHGAVDYIQKPQGGKFSENAQLIRERLKTAATAKHRRSVKAKAVAPTATIDMRSLIVLGASTGGTEALREVLEAMPSQIPPILIVQHIPPVFSAAFAKRLNDLLPFEVLEAKDGDEILPNRVLIAPGGKQMGIKTLKDKVVVRITDDPPVNRHKPSVDYLFRSVRDAKLRGVVGAVLTGMGADGARELKALRDSGARTIAQDEATSVVYGMPKEAALNGGAEVVLPLDRIASGLLNFCAQSGTKKRGA